MLTRLIRWLRTFKRAEEGIAYLEFALCLPFLLAMFMGAVEVTRYIIIVQKVEKATVTISDLVAQSETVTTTQLDILVEAVEQVMKPYSFDDDGYVIITSVSRDGTNPPQINWQYSGGGDWIHASEIGVSGGTATLPDDFTLNDNDTVIIAEVYYNFAPMMINAVVNGGMIYKFAIYKPRLGGGTTLGV